MSCSDIRYGCNHYIVCYNESPCPRAWDSSPNVQPWYGRTRPTRLTSFDAAPLRYMLRPVHVAFNASDASRKQRAVTKAISTEDADLKSGVKGGVVEQGDNCSDKSSTNRAVRRAFAITVFDLFNGPSLYFFSFHFNFQVKPQLQFSVLQ